MVIICTPTRDSISSGTAFDLIQLIKKHPEAYFSVSQGTILPAQRTGLVKEAIERHFGHILFIDSDMRFPEDLYEKLKAHNKDIVGVNYRHRQGNKWAIGKPSTMMKGLEEVDVIGFGAILIRTEVFVLTEAPWFATPYDGQGFVGEDVFFCRKAKEAGYKIFVDHDLSQEVKHIATKEI